MIWLLEDSFPALLGFGLVGLTLAYVWYQTRRPAWLWGLLAALLLAVGCWLLERLVVTPREEVERTLYHLADRVEHNDIDGLLAWVSPSVPQIRGRAQRELRRLRIEEARVAGGLEIEVRDRAQPPTATAGFFGRIRFRDLRGEFPYGAYLDYFRLQFRREGDRWLLVGYSSGGRR